MRILLDSLVYSSSYYVTYQFKTNALQYVHKVVKSVLYCQLKKQKIIYMGSRGKIIIERLYSVQIEDTMLVIMAPTKTTFLLFVNL